MHSGSLVRNLSAVAALLTIIGSSTILGSTEADPLEKFGARASEGAAPGYVEDRVCGSCHSQHLRGFQDVGMAQAFKRPAAARPVEDFGVEYFHAASQRYYQVLKDGEDLTFRRFQRDQDGAVVNQIEIPIAWVLGSGNRARSYLYRTDWGEMFLLPISWYAESRQWRMSPGFEQSAHQGIQRSIERECMFCHNAFPEVSAGSDAYWEAALFPSELPEGIGCQRCHGPGAEHIRTLLKGGSIEAVRDAIVNPADLPGEQRDSVCFQCHMLPSVSMVGARRVGLGTYSFRPGQVLSDYMVHVDIAEQGIESGERFEINHHAYRLIQSRCYLESEGALSCISCHNPHLKPASTAFREKSSGVCRGCHNDPENSHEVGADLQGGACIRCHMPTRRTSDVIEVTMTDHRIARGPFDLEALIKPVAKETRPVTGVGLLKFGDPPSGQHGDMYRFMAALRANRFLEPAKLGLERHLQRTTYSSPTPYIDLAQAQIRSGDFKGAESTSRRLIETYSELHVAYALLGMALLAQNHGEEAIENLLQSLAIQRDPETHFNLAAAYLQLGDIERAEQQLERALELRPYMAAAWKYKGIILNSRDEFERAREALVRSLQIEPLDSSVYRELITLLRKIGEYEEAERYLELGIRVSGDPSSLRSFE